MRDCHNSKKKYHKGMCTAQCQWPRPYKVNDDREWNGYHAGDKITEGDAEDEITR